jgi:hypothetical protein
VLDPASSTFKSGQNITVGAARLAFAVQRWRDADEATFSTRTAGTGDEKRAAYNTAEIAAEDAAALVLLLAPKPIRMACRTVVWPTSRMAVVGRSIGVRYRDPQPPTDLEGEVGMLSADDIARTVFFADAEHHSIVSPRTALHLRARMMCHLIFSDSLVVTDSQVLHNEVFRELISDPDFAMPARQLFESGTVVVARRRGHSFVDIAKEHAARVVENMPPIKYAEDLDELTAEHVLEWDLADVQNDFKMRSLLRLADLIDEDPSASFPRSAHEWIQNSEVLNYATFRQWLRGRPEAAAAHLLDDLVGFEYRMTIPSVLSLFAADSTEPGSALSYVRLESPAEDDIEATFGPLPVWILRPEVLTRLPLEAILEAKQLDCRREISNQLERLQVERAVEADRLTGAFEELFTRLGTAAIDYAEGKPGAALRELRQQPVAFRLKATREAIFTQSATLSVDVFASGVPAEVSLLCQLLFFARSMYSARTNDVAARKQQVETMRKIRAMSVEPENRLIQRTVLPVRESLLS